MLRKLPSINIENYNGRSDFSVNFQIKVTDQHAIAELIKRRDTLASQYKQYGDIGQSADHFHISITLFFPTVNNTQLAGLQEVISYINEKYENTNFNLALTEETKLFGYQSGNRFPVAIIEKMDALQQLQNDIQTQLLKRKIKINFNKEGFNPHVTLFISGIEMDADALNQLQGRRIEFTEVNSFEFSHKNKEDQYIIIDESQLAILKAPASLANNKAVTMFSIPREEEPLLENTAPARCCIIL